MVKAKRMKYDEHLLAPQRPDLTDQYALMEYDGEGWIRLKILEPLSRI
jgi:hypothetical protein